MWEEIRKENVERKFLKALKLNIKSKGIKIEALKNILKLKSMKYKRLCMRRFYEHTYVNMKLENMVNHLRVYNQRLAMFTFHQRGIENIMKERKFRSFIFRTTARKYL